MRWFSQEPQKQTPKRKVFWQKKKKTRKKGQKKLQWNVLMLFWIPFSVYLETIVLTPTQTTFPWIIKYVIRTENIEQEYHFSKITHLVMFNFVNVELTFSASPIEIAPASSIMLHKTIVRVITKTLFWEHSKRTWKLWIKRKKKRENR